MEEKTIRMLCTEKGMKNSELFIRFFMQRFPNESDRIHSYCEEWIDRFMSGNPVCYMDEESKKVFKLLIEEHSM